MACTACGDYQAAAFVNPAYPCHSTAERTPGDDGRSQQVQGSLSGVRPNGAHCWASSQEPSTCEDRLQEDEELGGLKPSCQGHRDMGLGGWW
jgi:hypothetical protein